MSTCSFVGLGVMGYPMAGHLQAAGYATTVYNRTTARADDWVNQHGGASAPTPREAATGAEAVLGCVGHDDDLRSAVFGDGGGLRRGGGGRTGGRGRRAGRGRRGRSGGPGGGGGGPGGEAIWASRGQRGRRATDAGARAPRP